MHTKSTIATFLCLCSFQVAYADMIEISHVTDGGATLSVTPTQIVASGGVSGGAAYYSYSSTFDVVFQVAEPQEITLLAELGAWWDCGGENYGFFEAWVTLTPDHDPFMIAVDRRITSHEAYHSFTTSILIDEVIWLHPGFTYTLSGGATGLGLGDFGVGGGGWAFYDIELTAPPAPVPVPLPGAALLGVLGTGYAGMRLRRRA